MEWVKLRQFLVWYVLILNGRGAYSWRYLFVYLFI